MARHSKVSNKKEDSDVIQNIVIKVPNNLKLSLVVRAIQRNQSLSNFINSVLESYCNDNPLDKSILERLG